MWISIHLVACYIRTVQSNGAIKRVTSLQTLFGPFKFDRKRKLKPIIVKHAQNSREFEFFYCLVFFVYFMGFRSCRSFIPRHFFFRSNIFSLFWSPFNFLWPYYFLFIQFFIIVTWNRNLNELI